MAQNIDILIKANDQASASIKKIDGEMSKLKKTTQEASKVSSTFGDTFQAIAAYDIGKTLGIGLLDTAKSAITLAGGLEQTRIAFTTMTGDARIADAFIREMTNFAKNTPFEIGQLENASKQLLAYGFEVEQVIPTLKMMGDISATVGMDKLPNLILALGQAKSATRLMGGELMQFTSAGVPLLENLSIVMQKPVSVIKDMVSKGQVGFPIVEQALKKMTSEGGIAFNAMEAQSKSLNGMISNFKDTFTVVLRDLGMMFLPGLKKMLADFMVFWDANGKSMVQSFTGFVITLVDFFGSALSGMASAFDIVMSFFQSNSKDTVGGIAISWKNFFLYLDLGIQAMGMAFKTIGAYIAFTMVNASYNAQIAWSAFGAFFSKVSATISASALYLGYNLASAIRKGIKLAIDGVNGLISALNKIPGVKIDAVGESFVAMGFQSFQAFQTIEDGFNGVNAQIDKTTSLTAEKNSMLAGIGRETMSMVTTDLGKMSDSYVNFTNAQQEAVTAGKTLAEVQAEIGKRQKNIIPETGATSGKKAGAGESQAEKDTKKLLDDLKALGKETAGALESVFSTLGTKADGAKTKLASLRDDYQKLKEKLKEVGEEGAKDLAKIQEQLDKQAKTMMEIRGGGKTDVATRAVEIEKELKKLRDEATLAGKGNEYDASTAKLEAELKLAKEYAGNTAIELARVEAGKSETQLIIDKTAKKIIEAETERAEIQKTYDLKSLSIVKEQAEIKAQMDAKKIEIKAEFDLYKSLILQRIAIDAQYFSLFQKNIQDQMNKTKEAITLIDQLKMKSGGNTVGLDGARANGGPVMSGGAYLVGERGPEVFMPKSSGTIIPNGIEGGITINMGGVSVRNEQDINALTDAIVSKITRSLQLQKLGIS